MSESPKPMHSFQKYFQRLKAIILKNAVVVLCSYILPGSKKSFVFKNSYQIYRRENMILHKELTNYSCSIYHKEQLQHTRNHLLP